MTLKVTSIGGSASTVLRGRARICRLSTSIATPAAAIACSSETSAGQAGGHAPGAPQWRDPTGRLGRHHLDADHAQAGAPGHLVQLLLQRRRGHRVGGAAQQRLAPPRPARAGGLGRRPQRRQRLHQGRHAPADRLLAPQRLLAFLEPAEQRRRHAYPQQQGGEQRQRERQQPAAHAGGHCGK